MPRPGRLLLLLLEAACVLCNSLVCCCCSHHSVACTISNSSSSWSHLLLQELLKANRHSLGLGLGSPSLHPELLCWQLHLLHLLLLLHLRLLLLHLRVLLLEAPLHNGLLLAVRHGGHQWIGEANGITHAHDRPKTRQSRRSGR